MPVSSVAARQDLTSAAAADNAAATAAAGAFAPQAPRAMTQRAGRRRRNCADAARCAKAAAAPNTRDGERAAAPAATSGGNGDVWLVAPVMCPAKRSRGRGGSGSPRASPRCPGVGPHFPWALPGVARGRGPTRARAQPGVCPGVGPSQRRRCPGVGRVKRYFLNVFPRPDWIFGLIWSFYIREQPKKLGRSRKNRWWVSCSRARRRRCVCFGPISTKHISRIFLS